MSSEQHGCRFGSTPAAMPLNIAAVKHGADRAEKISFPSVRGSAAVSKG
jgi:hypothetical protein